MRESELKVSRADGYYADNLAVVFRGIDHPASNQDVGPSVVLCVDPNGTLLDLDGLNAELEKLAKGNHGESRSFVSDMRATHTSWGADGAGVTFVLSVAGQVVGQFLFEGLKRIGQALGGLPANEPRPITEREAEHWARVMLRARFDGIDVETLAVTRLALSSQGASVGLRGADNSTYSVELELDDGLVAVGEVERKYPDP